MSGSSHGSYRSSYRDYEVFRSPDVDRATEARARRARHERLEEAREVIRKDPPPPPPKRETELPYDRKLVRLEVKPPDAKAKRLHVVLVDNSGSNRVIAEHLKRSSGWFTAAQGAIDPDERTAFVYFSDHGDDARMIQTVDYVAPDQQGSDILCSSIRHVDPANGFDEPEAIECALWQACDLPFGHVQERHLYLVTDVVAHGMGMRGDDGCPCGRDWRSSLERVAKTYRTFEVIGCGSSRHTGELQRKFILDPKRLPFDFIDLSGIPTHEHRCGITGNALLFLMARHLGLQSTEAFLMALYEKWLKEPLFGANTDLGAREAIERFTKYLEVPPDRLQELLDKIFG